MVFSSMIFLWLFLPILILIHFITPKKYRDYVLLAFSLIFYAWGEPKYILLILLSIIMNYVLALIMDKTNTKAKRKFMLIIALLFNLLLLGYFKYFNFLITNINEIFNTNIANKNIVLPIGISFYTFQIISYIIDLYRKEIKVQKNIFKLALYISFFPQLIAGPIVKYHDIEEQLGERNINAKKIADGIKRFIYGLGKKVIIANSVAVIADGVFNQNIMNLNTPLAWIGAIAYTIQIYFDFSGYSDMAIGLGKIFGFEFMENFNYPYISKSVSEFWRRWHISLSTWFKEYLYIPLGGNRKGKVRTYINLFIIFLATGIWHGASWNFMVWGLFNVFFIIIEKIKLKNLLDKNKFINYIYMFFVIICGWVIFRLNSIHDILEYFKLMFIPNLKTIYLNLNGIINTRTIIAIILGLLLSGLLQSLVNKNDKLKKFYKRYMELFVIISILLLSIIMLISNTYNPFIYFRF